MLFAGLVIPSELRAQLSGVVNSYAQVLRVDYCNNLAVVASASGFSDGDRVLLIQMQGATIDSIDAPTFGDISDLGSAGLYEILTIEDITSNIVLFTEAMINRYEGDGIQMVNLPRFNNASVDAEVNADPWNGLTGGVVAFEVDNTLTLNADINVTGLGFRGGTTSDAASCDGAVGGSSSSACGILDDCGAGKGEGIARVSINVRGRGAPANGGGGGNDSDTGGGGGSNNGDGGLGGQHRDVSGAECPGDNPGFGGTALDWTAMPTRVYMGGGGGGGDGNESAATSGGNGGGIVLIIADEIVGNGFGIFANGEAAVQATTDGAGGGGGGGAVLLDVDTYTGSLDLRATGGDGGDVNNGNDPSYCVGPGGGGGGGAIWVSGFAIPGGVTTALTGGTAGVSTNAGAPAACLGSSNGAQDGVDGSFLTSLGIPQSTLPFEPLTATVTGDSTFCAGDTALLSVLTASGTGTIGYAWSTGDSTQSIGIVPGVDGTTFNVTVLDERECGIVFVINVESTLAVSASRDPEGLVAPGQSVRLMATDDPLFLSYSWSPPDGLSSLTGANVTANPFESIEYCVTAMDTIGCETIDCVTVDVDILVNIPNAFTPNGDGLNDVFRVPSVGPCQELSFFYVWNRWGDLIFESGLDGIGWDGTWRGVPQEMDTYVYRIGVVCEGGLEKTFNGTVNLLR